MRAVRVLSLLITLSFTIGCGGGSKYQVAPGINFNPPSDLSIMLPPPTDEQQVDQPQTPTCAPAVGVTIYRVVTGKDYSFEQAISEMRTGPGGTQISEFVFWLNSHEMSASKTSLPLGWAVGMIAEQIKAGQYVVPYVNESARPDSPHVFIVYGIDNNRVLISDSNLHSGMNRFAVDIGVFESEWLVNVGTKETPSALLIFVSSRPRQTPPGYLYGSSLEVPKITHGELLIR